MRQIVIVALLFAAGCGSSTSEPPPIVTRDVHTCTWAATCDEVTDPVYVWTEVAAANCSGWGGSYSTTGCDPSWVGSAMPAGELPAWLASANVVHPGYAWTTFEPAAVTSSAR